MGNEETQKITQKITINNVDSGKNTIVLREKQTHHDKITKNLKMNGMA